MNINKLLLTGNLVADPELTDTKNGKSLVKVALANNDSYLTESGDRETVIGPGVEADDRRRRFLDLRDRCPGLVTGTELAARRSLSSRHTGHSRKFAAAEP
jgi:Single-strand binding protein family